MKTNKIISLILVSVLYTLTKGQQVVPLWEEGEKPYFRENNLKEYEEEAWGTLCVFDITEPTITVYKAQGNNSGKAVLIIPGGGYSLVALYHEGHDVAKILSENGITAAVLKYRLPNPKSSDKPEMVPLSDGRRALEILHKKANELGVDTNAIGVLGFSAGSHLSAVLSLWETENNNQKPDFSALIYGVTRLNEENQKWLEESLYFRKLSEKEVLQNQLLNLVTAKTPPAFLIHSYDDDICHYSESTFYADKLLENNVAVEMHLFPKGGHGFGIGRVEDGTIQWPDLFINWLKRMKF